MRRESLYRGGLWLAMVACTSGQDKAVDPSETDPSSDTDPTSDTELAVEVVPLDIECQLVRGEDRGEQGTTEIDVEVVAEGLEIPWGLGFLPDGSILVTERAGRVRMVEADGSLREANVMTVPVTATGEGGLLDVQTHPDFANNRYFYLYYTGDSSSGAENRVVRYILDEDGTGATEDRVIVDGIPASLYHNGGRLRFGPDGHLYVLTGDARVPDLSQDLDSLAGKVLRYTEDGEIPADNPFPDSPIYLYGLRNTQGIDWRDDGRIVITDHGPSGDLGREGHDELNVAEPGDNLGWPDIYKCQEEEGMVSPSMTWREALPPGGTAIYRGTEIPEWQGDVFIGVLGIFDQTAQQLHRARIDSEGNVTLHEMYLRFDSDPPGPGRIREVIMGPDGGLYLTTSNCDDRANCGQGDQILRIGRR